MSDHQSWYDQDEFWELFEPFLFNKERLSNSKAEVKNLIKLLKIQPKDKILDLCCGIGRHCLELAKYGFEVVGIDRTTEFLKRAKRKAEQKKLDVEFVISDMREYCHPDRFDVIINMFGSFGYFENDDDNRKVVRHMHTSLCPDGRLLIETMGKEVLAREFREKDWSEEGEMLFLFERQLSQNWSHINNRWIVIKDRQRIEHSVCLRSYSAVELSSLFFECGFSRVEIFGDLEGNPYDQNAKRLVIIGYK